MAPHNDAPGAPGAPGASVTVPLPPNVPPAFKSNLGESTAVGVGAAAGVLTAGSICAMMAKPQNNAVMTLSGAAGALAGSAVYGLLAHQEVYQILETGLAGFTGSVSVSELGQYIGYGYAKAKGLASTPEAGASCLQPALFAGIGAATGVTLKNTVRRRV